MINLDTGSLNVPNSATVVVGGVVADTTPSERVVYPAKTQQYIVVQPCHKVVLTAYNGEAAIYKVLLSNGVPELGTLGCDPVIKSAESIILNQAYLPQYSKKVLVELDVPGIYIAKASTGSEDDLVLTAVDYSCCGC